MTKVCFILRGLPGSGKSNLTRQLAYLYETADVPFAAVSADDYFIDKDGNYNFDINLIGEAHEWCRAEFVKHVTNSVNTIVVDNTNCKESEFQHYKDFAEQHGYTVFVLIVENRHGNKSVHDVPEHTLNRRESLLRNSIKLR